MAEELFTRIDNKTAADNQMDYQVEVSYMEIYNEKGECPVLDMNLASLITMYASERLVKSSKPGRPPGSRTPITRTICRGSFPTSRRVMLTNVNYHG